MEGVLLQDLSFIALDLETTGVDEQAEIIEIGLVKVCQGNIVEKYEKLIKPSKSIPEEITLLTGINNDMVLTKSTWPEIQSEVLEFIDDNLIVAHNASFDRGFLEKALGFELANFWIDTYDLAKIVAPTLPSYKLLYLTQVLNIKIKKNHRALFDAQACAQIFLSLVNSLSTLSPFLLEKILDIYLEEKEEGLPFLLNEIQKNNIANFSFDEKINTKTKKDGNVEEILDFSRPMKRLEFELVNINKVIDDLVTLYEDKIDSKGIELKKEVHSLEIMVDISPKVDNFSRLLISFSMSFF